LSREGNRNKKLKTIAYLDPGPAYQKAGTGVVYPVQKDTVADAYKHLMQYDEQDEEVMFLEEEGDTHEGSSN
jgi:hypothetical protein